MQSTIKNKFITTFLAFIFVLVGTFFINNPVVSAAKLKNTAFWGVTANFNANAIEGFVINVNENSYQEKFSSVFYGTTYVDLGSGTMRQPCGDGSGLWCYHPFVVTSPGNKQFSDSPAHKEYLENWYHASNTEENIQNYLNAIAQVKTTESFQNLTASDWMNHTKFNGESTKDFRKQNAVFTWPSWQGAGDVSDAELQYLNKLSSTLTNDYNNAISLLLNNNKKSLGTTSASSSQKMAFLNLAADIAITAKDTIVSGNQILAVNYQNLGKDGSYGIQVKARFEKITDEEFKSYGYNKINGLSKDDVIKITIIEEENGKIKDGDSIVAIWRYPKGYSEGQDLRNILISRAGSDIFKGNYISKLDWTHIAYQSIFNFTVSGVDSMGAGDLYATDDGFIGNMFASLINSIINGLTNLLGLFNLEELCLNQGSRSVTYWNGIFPKSWFSASQYFYLFTFTLSMLMLLIAMVRLAGQKAASTIGNVAKRISLLEGIKKIVICSICVMLFVPIFTVLVSLNSMIVSTLTTLIPEGQSLNFVTGSLSGLGLAGAFVSAMLFWVTIKMNFTYILRAITVLLCYILAPIAIMCTAVGDKFGQITSNWLKELLGNIFIQAVHALIMMIFITIAGSGSVARIEKLVLIYSFIPLTEFVRTNLFALGKGLDQVAENLGQGLQDGGRNAMATMAATSAANKRMAGAGAGNGGGTLQGKAGNMAGGYQKGLEEKSSGMVPGTVGGWGQKLKDKGAAIKSGATNVLKHPGRAAAGALATTGKVAGRYAMASASFGGMLASGAMSSTGRMTPGATMQGGRALGGHIYNQVGNVGEYFSDLAEMQAADAAREDLADLKENSYPIDRRDYGDVYGDENGKLAGFVESEGNCALLDKLDQEQLTALNKQMGTNFVQLPETNDKGVHKWANTGSAAKDLVNNNTHRVVTPAGKNDNGVRKVNSEPLRGFINSQERTNNLKDNISQVTKQINDKHTIQANQLKKSKNELETSENYKEISDIKFENTKNNTNGKNPIITPKIDNVK